MDQKQGSALLVASPSSSLPLPQFTRKIWAGSRPTEKEEGTYDQELPGKKISRRSWPSGWMVESERVVRRDQDDLF